jgi:apolipoprotein N-acyltransferase
VHRYLLAIGSGLALWLAFPDHNLWPLAIVGVALLALATRDAGPGRGFLLGLVSGCACFIPLLSWSGIYVGRPPWFALSVLEALFIALLGCASGLLQGRPFLGRRQRWPSLAGHQRVRPLVIALLWVAQEWLRSRQPFGGFPWGRLAFSQADSPLVHLAAWAGAPLVTFAVALAGGGLAAGVARVVWARTERGVLARVLKGVPAVAGAVALTFLPVLIPTPVDGPKVTVMGVQGNVPQAGLEFNAQRRAVLDNHATLTETAAREVRSGDLPQPDLVVWPENSSDIDPLRNADAAEEINHAVRDIDAPVIVGAVLDQPAPDVSNASLLYLPGKGPVDRYIKRHPVPFAEYIPYRSFFRHFSDKVDLVSRDFTAGHKVGIFTVPSRHAGTIVAGPTICFEVAYDGLVRDAVDAGANLLVVQTNNATFGYSDESQQQLAISRLRAVEHGRSVVHISTVGVSGLITPDGTVHQRSSLFTAALLSGQLPLRDDITLADRVGDWPEGVASATAALLILVGIGRRRLGRVAQRPEPQTREP